jgi:hypothetical protein
VIEGWTDAALHRQVLETGTLSTSKTKEVYGHFSTKTQMRGLEGPYWTEDPADVVAKETRHLNIHTLNIPKRLQQLRTDKIGGILVVTKFADKNGETTPFLTLLAAPSVATFNPTMGDAGVILDDIWDETALADFRSDLVCTEVHCPVVGAREDFSCSLQLKPTVVNSSVLQDAQPFFLPEGEQTCVMVANGTVDYPRTIFLPEVCNLPIGMRWPVNIGFLDFLSSIQATLGNAGMIFQWAMLAIEPIMTKWFDLITEDTDVFLIRGCPILPLYDDHFPAIDTGLWPDTVQDKEGFLPLLDLVNGHV